MEKEQFDIYNYEGINITNGKYDEFKYDFNSGLQLAIKKIKDPKNAYPSIGEDRYFIDQTGKVILIFPNTEYHEAEPFCNGLAKIEKRNKDEYDYDGDFGFVDSTGKVIIPYLYKEATNFHGSCAFVAYEEKGKRKYALINKKNEKVLIFDDKYDDYWYDKEQGKRFFRLDNGEVYDFDGNKIEPKK